MFKSSRRFYFYLKRKGFLQLYRINTYYRANSDHRYCKVNQVFTLPVRTIITNSVINIEDQKTEEENTTGVNSHTFRTHTCGELGTKHVGQKVTICGWVQYMRMSKFLVLRDAYGVTQCLINNTNVDLSNISLETILKIQGTVVPRPLKEINHNLPTGEIEVVIDNFEILNNAENLPFNLRDYQKPKEQLRLQHRYIDLRFPEMQDILRKRSDMLHNIRRFLIEKKAFVEVETPTLFCRTPGGAREFVVPTHHSGLFYSLVQSPQQFKQMLMAGGIDRYFQVARCYRDETTRPDRQPEFTQLDIEISFTDLHGILTIIEELMYETYVRPIKKPPFKRITYKEAIENYGTDKPNVGHGLKFKNITDLFSENVNKQDFFAYALPYPANVGKFTTKSKESIRDIKKRYPKTKIVLNENVSKELGEDISTKMNRSDNETNFIIALGDQKDSLLCLGEIRLVLTTLLKSKGLLQEKELIEPLWITDFPLFTKDCDGKLETCHHPFTAPNPEDSNLLDKDPLKVRSLAYDLVINGNEVGGGSVRVHNVRLQEKLLKMLNIDSTKLTHFLDALKSGCPPHAGIALGIDRLMAIGCDVKSIRDVIAFPKSYEGKDPLSGAPSPITEEDKKFYNIATVSKN